MKKNPNIGRLCAMFSVLAFSQSINAQNLQLETTSSLRSVPASVTVDNKPRLTASENAEIIHIYNNDLVQEKSITLQSLTYRSGSRKETADVEVTGAKISDFYIYGFCDYDIQAPTLEAARLILAAQLGSNYTVTTYDIDGKSFIHCYRSTSTSSGDYYLYDLFNRTYPRYNCYTLEDGMLQNVDISYTPIYDENSAVWTVTEDNTYDNSAYKNAISYKDADSGFESMNGLIVSQTVFNSDDKWEYIVPTYDNQLEEPGSVSTSGSVNADGKITLNRSVYIIAPYTGLNIVSEDGTVIASISANQANTLESYVSSMSANAIWRINGKNYLEINKSIRNQISSDDNDYSYSSIYALYLINDGATALSKVMEYETEAGANSNIYNINGQQLSEKPTTGVYIQGGKKFVAQ